jgi:T5SS/PEP-CTERM-associated repeat protein
VNSYGGHVGYYPDSISNDAQVEGSGSRWNLLSEHLYVARGGDSNSVTISAGGTVAIEGDGKGLRIGVQAVADNNRVTVTGSGSLLSVNDAILIGQSGTNSSLTVAAGGSVSNGGAGFLGYLAGSSGTATVTGEDSQWNNADSLYIGGHSSAAGGSGTARPCCMWATGVTAD